MAKLGKIKASLEGLSQTINLKEVFGRDVSDRPALKQAFAQAVIDHIVERSESGKAVTGRNLKKPYSDEYAETLEFLAAGKSKGAVNMKLTGDMLRSIDLIDEDAQTITIGIDDPNEAPKAFNHQTGDTVPKRPFFGINQRELNDIAGEFDLGPESPGPDAGPSVFQSFALEFLRGLRGQSED